MRLPKPDIVPGDIPGQVRQFSSYLIRLHRALEMELEALRKSARQDRSMEEIINGVLTSEKALDTIYNYCQKRRKKEEAEDGTTS